MHEGKGNTSAVGSYPYRSEFHDSDRYPLTAAHTLASGNSFYPLRRGFFAAVAQLVELCIRNAKVEGSTPFIGTKSKYPHVT